MFIVSYPELVIAQSQAGIIGTFPSLNARKEGELDTWLRQIKHEIDPKHHAKSSGLYGVNLINHHSNNRLEEDLACIIKHKVPLVITSLGAPDTIVPQIQEYGGLVFHDVTNIKHAKRAAKAGVDGLVLVCAGAGGHAGSLNPFAFVTETKNWFDGLIILSGSLSNGHHIAATKRLGADFSYMGTRFIATKEAHASSAYKEMITASQCQDIVYTPFFTGVAGNYLAPSIKESGLDPDNLPTADKTKMNFSQEGLEEKETTSQAKAWKEVWSAGQGVGCIDDIPSVASLVNQFERDYLKTTYKEI